MRPDYIPLSSHVVEAFEKTARVPPNLAMREAAAYLASVTWGIEKVQALTVLLNVAGLAVASGDTVPLYTLGQGVVRRVAEALETMVTVEAPPSMMKEPWIIEPFGYERGASLAGDVWSIGGYAFEAESSYLVWLRGDGAYVEPWFPAFPGNPDEMVSDTVMVEGAILDKHVAQARGVLRWALAFGRLLDDGVFRTSTKNHPITAGRVVRHTVCEMPGDASSLGTLTPVPRPPSSAAPGGAAPMNRRERREAERRRPKGR